MELPVCNELTRGSLHSLLKQGCRCSYSRQQRQDRYLTVSFSAAHPRVIRDGAVRRRKGSVPEGYQRLRLCVGGQVRAA